MPATEVPIKDFGTMPIKKKRAKAAATPPIELIVRRGALRRFDKLKQATATLPVKVLWDRRTGEGRTAAKAGQPEPERRERRQKPPFTWDVADFVVVGKPASERRRKAKR